jgi:predicted DNA-binding mobile mystery protein A
MSVKRVAAKQYQTIVDRAAETIAQLPSMPLEGWVATARKAVGMSAAQLARRLGVTRARISHMEQGELSGALTLKTMRVTAEAIGCRFVYAIVPIEGRIEDTIAAHARKKAQALVTRASAHMGLESQSLPGEKNKAEVERIADELLRSMPSDLWDDK